jgi:hypothetical protein
MRKQVKKARSIGYVYSLTYREEGPPEQANKTLPFFLSLFLNRSKTDLYFPMNT